MLTQETIIAKINQLDPTVLSQEGWSDAKGYLNRTYRFLQNIEPGRIYQVANLSSNPPLFVAVVQLYQCEVKGNTIVFIYSDYQQFKKYEQL